jgi:diguanylate cyclase (GGDEF)-like protein
VALLVPLALLTLLLGYLVITRRAASPQLPPHPVSPDEGDTASVQRSKVMMEDMLKVLVGRVETQAKSARAYEDTLANHREALQHAHNLRSMREIEALLLSEVDAMRKANDAYRKQLDKANETIKEQQVQLDALSVDATIDFLTQVPNRRAFDKRLHEEIERYRRGGPCFSLILVDIDHFKQVNDRYGHQTGDATLQRVAQILEGDRRNTDFVARFGGEEFAVILPCTDEYQAATLIDRMREQLESTTIDTGGMSLSVTISAGVAEMLPADKGTATLLQRADERLYRAKHAGRNIVVVR